MQPTTDRTDPDCAHRHGDAGVRMDRVCDTVSPRLLRALISMGRALRHPWALAIAERPMRGAAIDTWEWVDAKEAQATQGGPEPFPLTYTGDDCRLRWTHDSAGLMVVITRPFAEVAILRERLRSAEQELLALNGAGVDGMSKMSAEWPTLAPLLNAHKAALLALESETLKQGQIVCGALLKADGTAEWHPATAAPPQRAEGRHWRLLMKLIHAAGYALPPIRFNLDLDRALDAMGRYEGLATATREAGYKVPSLPSDELISWIAWGIKAGTNHSALEEFVSETVVALGGQVPPPDVVRLWVITSGASLQEIAAELRAQQLHLRFPTYQPGNLVEIVGALLRVLPSYTRNAIEAGAQLAGQHMRSADTEKAFRESLDGHGFHDIVRDLAACYRSASDAFWGADGPPPDRYRVSGKPVATAGALVVPKSKPDPIAALVDAARVLGLTAEPPNCSTSSWSFTHLPVSADTQTFLDDLGDHLRERRS